jgi:hypothetical protein
MRVRIGVSHAPGLILFILGAAALITATITASNIMAFIGLGLTFWGAILLYIQTSDQIPTSILDASISPYPDTLDQMVQALDLQGDPVVLPPKYFENPEDTAIFIPKQKNGPRPTPEQTQQNKNQYLTSNPPGILLTPPGAELNKLFEKTLETSFTTVNMEYLQQHLQKLLIEDLEIATDFEMQTQNTNASENKTSMTSAPDAANNIILMRIVTNAYQNTFKQAAQHPNTAVLSCPLTSAIAIAIAKATGKPVSMETRLTSKDGTEITVQYHLEQEPTQP